MFNSVCKKIKKIRIDLKIKRKDVVNILKCNRTDVVTWEKTGIPPMYRFVELSCLYGVKMQDIVTANSAITPRLTGYNNYGRNKYQILGGIGDRIKMIRESKNIPIKELAKQTKVSELSILRWENELTYPNLHYCLIISKKLDVDIDQLVPLLD